MLNNKNQNQKVDNNSNAYQANRDINIHTGLSYNDVKNITLDIFQLNYLKLSKEAADLAFDRVKKFVDNYIEEVKKDDKINQEQFKEPALQAVIYEAQKEYAKTGEDDLGNLLTDLLIQRTKEEKRNLRQIALSEAITVVGKLTDEDIKILSLIFVVVYATPRQMTRLVDYTNYINHSIVPFCFPLKNDSLVYNHLKFAGCSTPVKEGGTWKKFGELMQARYTGLFQKGFSKEEFEKNLFPLNKYPTLVTNYLHDNKLLQINALNEAVLISRATMMKVPSKDIEKLKSFYKRFTKTPKEIEDYTVTINNKISTLIKAWNNYQIKSLDLTPIGVAIANSNLKKVVGRKGKLSVWI